MFFQFPLGVIFYVGKKSPPKNMHRKLKKSGESGKEMQVHLADVARFSRFCDGMWLIRVLRFFTDGSYRMLAASNSAKVTFFGMVIVLKVVGDLQLGDQVRSL